MTAAIPLPTTGQTGLPTTLVAPTVAGVMQPVMTLLMQVEVAALVKDGSHSGTTVSSPEVLARPVASRAQAMAHDTGWMEGDAAKGSLEVMVLGERLASAPLMPFVTRGGVPVGASQREGLVALEASGESSLTQTSVGIGSPMWGAPLL